MTVKTVDHLASGEAFLIIPVSSSLASQPVMVPASVPTSDVPTLGSVHRSDDYPVYLVYPATYRCKQHIDRCKTRE